MKEKKLDKEEKSDITEEEFKGLYKKPKAELSPFWKSLIKMIKGVVAAIILGAVFGLIWAVAVTVKRIVLGG